MIISLLLVSKDRAVYIVTRIHKSADEQIMHTLVLKRIVPQVLNS